MPVRCLPSPSKRSTVEAKRSDAEQVARRRNQHRADILAVSESLGANARAVPTAPLRHPHRLGSEFRHVPQGLFGDGERLRGLLAFASARRAQHALQNSRAQNALQTAPAQAKRQKQLPAQAERQKVREQGCQESAQKQL